jgi:citrate synthase
VDGMLTSTEAAARLGVKVSTLYVYVSRGLLVSHRAPEGRRSLFRVEDVEALARRSRGGRSVESRLAVVTTAITELRADGPSFRGRSAIGLAAGTSPEEVAELLWNAGPGSWAPTPIDPPPGLAPRDRMPWTVVMVGAADPLRSDLRPSAVVRAARRLISTLATGPSVELPADAPLALRLATTCTGPNPPAPVVRAFGTAMVLLADHELATSTLAVRVAASTRADLYDALLAGLGTLAGPLHGSASRLVLDLLRRAGVDGAPAALDDALRWQGLVPGFGHGAYPHGDPRHVALLEAVRDIADDERRTTVEQVIALAENADLPEPNIDLALGALAYCTDMAPEALPLLFAVARCPGWVAHYMEELDEAPLRFRARAVHVTSSQG